MELLVETHNESIDTKRISVSHLWPELDLFCQPTVALLSLPTLSSVNTTPILYLLRYLVFGALPAEVGFRYQHQTWCGHFCVLVGSYKLPVDTIMISVCHLWPELDLFCQPSTPLFLVTTSMLAPVPRLWESTRLPTVDSA